MRVGGPLAKTKRPRLPVLLCPLGSLFCLSDLVNIQGIRGQLFKVNLYLINIHETLTVRND